MQQEEDQKKREEEAQKQKEGVAIQVQTSSKTLPKHEETEEEADLKPGMVNQSQQLSMGNARMENPDNALDPKILQIDQAQMASAQMQTSMTKE